MIAGERRGPYEIVESIGKGGMGEVYRARDTRVGRDVAIKISSEQFGERFEREAQTIASLNHPNICTLYDVGPDYLVMELVEGDSRQGPLPLDTALDYARQIAAALEAAHDRGIVHRDLKPGNIKVTPQGLVKVLDFGLAKTLPGARAVTSDNSPTFSMAATQAGVIVGTAAYMAPEQARGQAVDKRADIWAFGVVLYEMVTGKRLFQGEDLTDTLAAVVRDKADLSAAPPQLRRVLERCLREGSEEAAPRHHRRAAAAGERTRVSGACRDPLRPMAVGRGGGGPHRRGGARVRALSRNDAGDAGGVVLAGSTASHELHE
jgi:serine/threonine protein kinase